MLRPMPSARLVSVTKLLPEHVKYWFQEKWQTAGDSVSECPPSQILSHHWHAQVSLLSVALCRDKSTSMSIMHTHMPIYSAFVYIPV